MARDPSSTLSHILRSYVPSIMPQLFQGEPYKSFPTAFEMFLLPKQMQIYERSLYLSGSMNKRQYFYQDTASKICEYWVKTANKLRNLMINWR